MSPSPSLRPREAVLTLLLLLDALPLPARAHMQVQLGKRRLELERNFRNESATTKLLSDLSPVGITRWRVDGMVRRDDCRAAAVHLGAGEADGRLSCPTTCSPSTPTTRGTSSLATLATSPSPSGWTGESLRASRGGASPSRLTSRPHLECAPDPRHLRRPSRSIHPDHKASLAKMANALFEGREQIEGEWMWLNGRWSFCQAAIVSQHDDENFNGTICVLVRPSHASSCATPVTDACCRFAPSLVHSDRVRRRFRSSPCVPRSS